MGRKSLLHAAPDQTRLRIEAMHEERERRRNQIKQAREDRAAEQERNISAGNPGDVDFIGLVRKWRDEHEGVARPHRRAVGGSGGGQEVDKICVSIRKRPLNDKERKKKEHDAVTVLHPTATVHSAKLRVDGIHKYLDHNSFRFDHCFDEDCSTETVYQYTAKPLVSYVCGGKGVRATVFAFGQTGSGKTYTMQGIQRMVAEEIFSTLSDNVLEEEESCCSYDNTNVSIAIFEIYGGRVQDLLNRGNRLKVLEDGRGEVVISGLEEFEASSPDEFLELVEAGQNNRTTHATEANDESSRSHSVCQVLFRDPNTRRLKAKLSLVDLAGSERGSDTKSNNRQRRAESSDINTSLLALKECIRAIDGDSKHVPYRQSKLTLILKDSFIGSVSRTAMIATLAPGSLSTDHTVNTLRYADRIKEKKIGDSLAVPQRKSPVRQHESPVRKKLVETVDDELEHCDEIDEENINANIISKTDNKSEEKQKETQVEVPGHSEDIEEEQGPTEFDKVVQQLFDEEELLLSLHMQVIQQNAEYITEENKLLESVQGEQMDVDAYAVRLAEILQHKTEMIQTVRGKLEPFRELLRKEEELSHKY